MIEVVFNASKEVRMPILNSTLIVVVSFVRFCFPDRNGRGVCWFVGHLPLLLALLFASTVVALTLTPVLCSYLLGNKAKDLPKRHLWPYG